jgi:protein-disulfide isomerase
MPEKSRFWKYFFISLASIIALFLIIFLIFFVYFTVQLKYGKNETIQNLVSTYEKNFSSIIDKNAPVDVVDFKKLIQSYNPKQGETDLPIKIIAFMDFECPYCQDNYSIFKYITDKYKPVIQVIFKHLPLTEIHPNALNSALASTCAQDQNKFWEFYNQIYTIKNLKEDLTI